MVESCTSRSEASDYPTKKALLKKRNTKTLKNKKRNNFTHVHTVKLIFFIVNVQLMTLCTRIFQEQTHNKKAMPLFKVFFGIECGAPTWFVFAGSFEEAWTKWKQKVIDGGQKLSVTWSEQYEGICRNVISELTVEEAKNYQPAQHDWNLELTEVEGDVTDPERCYW